HEFHPQRARSALHDRYTHELSGIGRIDENGSPHQRRNGFPNQLNTLGVDLEDKKGQASQIAAGAGEAGHEPSVDGIDHGSHHNRNGRGGGGYGGGYGTGY